MQELPSSVAHDYKELNAKLINVIQRISCARSLAAITEIVRRAARELTRADGATFVLRDGECCHYADEDAISPLWKGQRFPMKVCISGWVMLNQQAVVIEDIYADARIPIDAYRPTFVKSLAMVPINTAAPIGAIGNYWAVRRLPSPHEVSILQALAAVVASSIERLQLYAKLEARILELDTANRAKDDFLMTLSHELRTPLNAISGWSEILLTEELSADEMREGLSAIKRNAQDQAYLIGDLLDSTQIVTGRLTLQKGPLNLADALQASVDSVRPKARQKSITVRYQPFAEFGSLDADYNRLQQIFSNLLANAIKFTPVGGNVEVSVWREGPHACIQIKDDGEGITSEFLPHVFERFRQSDSSITRRHGGLGLGLAIVKYLAEAHGGYVTVASTGLGQGASFKVFLPLSSISRELVSVMHSIL